MVAADERAVRQRQMALGRWRATSHGISERDGMLPFWWVQQSGLSSTKTIG